MSSYCRRLSRRIKNQQPKYKHPQVVYTYTPTPKKPSFWDRIKDYLKAIFRI